MSIEGLSSEEFKQVKSAIDEAAIVAITDKSGMITYVNDKFCNISKYSRAELVGKTHRVINSGYHPKDFFGSMWKTIASGKTWEGEICNRAKDGSFYWVNTTIVPFLGSDGKPMRFVAVRYDITKKILAEENLKIEAQKLVISNRELQDFASIAAHDLQEPLRKIQWFSDRLRSLSTDSLSTEVLDFLRRIQKSANRMQILINDLLSYSRLTSKAQPFIPVNLNDVLNHVISDLEVRLQTSQGKISFDDMPTIDSDPVQMHQLFLNLINNALKFRRDDVPPLVHVSAKILENSLACGQTFEISIADNGIGFDEKYLDRIFTIFQRLHGRNEYEGTGIGLALCRKIVEGHKGLMTAKSTPNEGSTFVVTLPSRAKKLEI